MAGAGSMTIMGWDRATPWRIMIPSATEWRGPSEEKTA